MAVISNVKAQANKLFSTVKSSNATNSAKSLLVDEGVFARGQKRVLNNINSKTISEENAINAIRKEIGDEAANISSGNINMIQNIGIDGVNDKNTKRFMKRRSESGISDLQKETILKSASAKALNYKKPIGDTLASSLITKSAQEIDGALAIKTPFAVAREYYGSPIMGAMKSTNNKEEFLSHASKAGARIGVTAGAFAGTKSIASNLKRGDESERY